MDEDSVLELQIAQNLRNSAIDILETLSSEAELRGYQTNVAWIYVPYEVMEQWHDVSNSVASETFGMDVITFEEREAFKDFNLAMEKLNRTFPKDFPPFEQILKRDDWRTMMASAKVTLDVLTLRGKFQETSELENLPCPH